MSTGAANIHLRGGGPRAPASFEPSPISKIPLIEDNGSMRLNNTVFYPERERIAVFIDGTSLHWALRAVREHYKHLEVDYRRLHTFLSSLGHLLHVNYYIVNEEGPNFNSIRPLLDWLDYNNYTIITRPHPAEGKDSAGNPRSGMGVHIAVDALLAAVDGGVNHVVLFTGDGDLCPVVAACQRRQVKVTLVSTLSGGERLTDDGLRRQATQFLDLADIMPLLLRIRPAEPVPVAEVTKT